MNHTHMNSCVSFSSSITHSFAHTHTHTHTHRHTRIQELVSEVERSVLIARMIPHMNIGSVRRRFQTRRGQAGEDRLRIQHATLPLTRTMRTKRTTMTMMKKMLLLVRSSHDPHTSLAVQQLLHSP